MVADDTLTDRYIAAVARSVPAAERAEVAAELRASIADELDARLAAGEQQDAAEYAVIAEFGDPIAYAASLSGRPLVLIGPRYYAAWLRVLRLLLVIAVPSAIVISGFVRAVQGGGIGPVFGAIVPAAILTGVQVAFWTTLAFAIMERVGSTGDTVLEWTPERLPRAVVPTARFADAIGSGVVFAILIGAVIWDRAVGWGDQGVHLLSAQLWPWTIGVWFALLALGFALQVVAAVRGRWTVPLAALDIAASLVALIGAVMLIWRGAVLDEALLAQMRAASSSTTDVVQIVDIVLTVVIGGILVGILFDAYRKLGLARER